MTFAAWCESTELKFKVLAEKHDKELEELTNQVREELVEIAKTMKTSEITKIMESDYFKGMEKELLLSVLAYLGKVNVRAIDMSQLNPEQLDELLDLLKGLNEDDEE